MKRIFGQWVEHDDDEQVYYFYKVKDDMYIFNHWVSGSPWREYSEDFISFKEHTTFKVTLIY